MKSINDNNMMEEFAKLIPAGLNNLSGSVFYSGRNAFQGKKSLYVLGLNPGGDVIAQQNQTVFWHTQAVLQRKFDCWSEYKDASWNGQPPGTYGLQPRVLHLFNVLGAEPGEVPSSNLCFVRTNNQAALAKSFFTYAALCWDFHQKVINDLEVKVILCFGKVAGEFVQNKFKANIFIGEFVERNNRRWKTQAFKNEYEQVVILATHPSRADWTNPVSDPSSFIKSYLPAPLQLSHAHQI
jgi:hypothetical protein